MPGNWNPSAPDALGLEWRGFYTYLEKRTASPFKADRRLSTITEAIAALRFGIGPTVYSTQPAFRLLEVYREADVLLDAAQVGIDRFVPNAHGTGTGIGNWRTQAGSATTIYTSIDDVVKYPPTGSDYIRNSTTASAAFFHFNSAAFPLTRRVGRLRFRGVAAGSGGWRDINFRLWHSPTATFYTPPGASRRFHAYGILHEVDLGEINPVTLLPWTPLDVRGFGSAANVWQIRIGAAGSVANEARVFNLELEVQYRNTENRAAIGTWERPVGNVLGQPASIAGAQNRNKFVQTDQLVEPNGAGGWRANWSKLAGEAYVTIMRGALDRLVGGDAARATDIHWAFVGGEDRDGPVRPPIPGMAAGPVVFGSASNLVTGGIHSAGPFTESLGAALAPIVTGAGTVASNDSQPYVVRLSNLQPDNAKASDSRNALQTLTPGSSASYLGVRFVIKPPADGLGILRVTIHSWNGSDSTLTDPQIGGAFDVTAADALAGIKLPNLPGYRDVRGILASAAALTAGGDYYVRFTKISGTAGSAWELLRLFADLMDEATFQGGIDAQYLNQSRSDGTSIFQSEDDLGVQITRQPDPPAAVTAAVVSNPAELKGIYCAGQPTCDVPFIDYVRVTWNSPGTYGANFDRWQVERQEQGSTDWERIAEGSSQTVRYFEDWEAIRDKPVKYRARALMTNGAFSNWVETALVTPASHGEEVIFTSNARPDLSVAYTFDPTVPIGFLQHENDELMVIQGAPYRVAFMDPHDRGVSLSYRIATAFGAQPQDGAGNAIGTEAVFQPLIDIARGFGGDLPPYVCVLDYEGGRRFAYISLSDGVREMPEYRYYCTVSVVTVTNVPSIDSITGQYLSLPGVSGSYFSSPDVAAADITGDITMMVELDMGGWAGLAAGTVISKFRPADNNASYLLDVIADGQWRAIWSPNGTVASQVAVASASAFPTTATGVIALAVEIDVNLGGTQKSVKFYTAPSIDGPWTLVRTDTSAGTTSIFSGAAQLEVGSYGGGTTSLFAGRVRAARIVNGLIASTDIRVNPTPANVAPDATSFTDSTGKVWTRQGTAAIVAY